MKPQGIDEKKYQGIDEKKSQEIDEKKSQGIDEMKSQGIDENKSQGIYKMNSQGIFYLGKFYKIWTPIPIPFYIQFPKRVKTSENIEKIPYYSLFGNLYYDIKLYWSSFSNPKYLDRRISGLQFISPEDKNSKKDSYIHDVSKDYSRLHIHKSIITEINDFLNNNESMFTLYKYEDYIKLK